MPPILSHRRAPCAVPILLCLAFLATQAGAQPTPQAQRPDPLDPKPAVPALHYESALAQYRRLSDEKPVSWRDANDAVARIGGWRFYAREAQRAEPPVPAAPAGQSAAMPSEMKPDTPPAGHRGHGQP